MNINSMPVIKIEKTEKGTHDNQWPNHPIELKDGWAVIPTEVGTPDTLENYPSGDITIETRNGIPYVTSWKPGQKIEPKPGSDEPQYTELQLLGQQVTDLELMILGGGVNRV